VFAPFSVFNVRRGKRYRFRYINSGFNVCPFLLQIQDHNMTVISSEISYVEPLLIDSLYSMAGERFDFVLNADQKPKDYWIRVKTMLPCRDIVEAFAILRYGEDHKMAGDQRIAFSKQLPPVQSDKFPQKKLFNSPMPKVKDIPIIKMKAYDSDESIIVNPPDYKHFLFIDSPTILDDTMDKDGNYYKLSCE
jgi:FtsP/CotA-like multicopper oxidase with cupredoxin domain